ncbi:MAG TPA: hypothetical protein VG917_05755 [Patescibacteria group bacterium]|nr:hypothetical protein [Patescibacteria group bacterium]
MEESTDQLSPQERLQHDIERLWEDESYWEESHSVPVDGLPEGLRVVELRNSGELVLRSLVPNAPENSDPNKPSDIPIAVFNTLTATPEEMRKEALKLHTAIMNGDIKLDKAHPPIPPQNR